MICITKCDPLCSVPRSEFLFFKFSLRTWFTNNNSGLSYYARYLWNPWLTSKGCLVSNVPAVALLPFLPQFYLVTLWRNDPFHGAIVTLWRNLADWLSQSITPINKHSRKYKRRIPW